MKYVEGDLFNHVPAQDDTITIIAHVCNNIGAWGAGFVIPLARRYPNARTLYHEASGDLKLGWTQFVTSDDGKVVVANMVGQEGVGPTFDENDKMIPPIRYDALSSCMKAVRDSALLYQQSGKKVRIACPMFGAGLAGGDWPTIENMIVEIWGGLDTTVYYLPQFLPPGWTPPKSEA